jgi:hypothetical protein
MFVMGEHRIICGDSTDPRGLEALMPPGTNARAQAPSHLTEWPYCQGAQPPAGIPPSEGVGGFVGSAWAAAMLMPPSSTATASKLVMIFIGVSFELRCCVRFPSKPEWLLPSFHSPERVLEQRMGINSVGVGRLTHLTGELLQHEAHIKLQLVPYVGGPAHAISDVATGRVGIIIEGYSGAGEAIGSSRDCTGTATVCVISTKIVSLAWIGAAGSTSRGAAWIASTETVCVGP